MSGVITAFAKMATGLRADALESVRELRQRALASRRQRDEEVRRKALERDVAHLEHGMERWIWGNEPRTFCPWSRLNPAARPRTARVSRLAVVG